MGLSSTRLICDRGVFRRSNNSGPVSIGPESCGRATGTGNGNLLYGGAPVRGATENNAAAGKENLREGASAAARPVPFGADVKFQAQ